VEEGSTRLEEEEEEEKKKKKKALLWLEHHPQEEEQPEVGQKPPQVILASLLSPASACSRISWLLTYCSVVSCVANTPSVFRCLFL
jgi:hypothetical protein